MRGLVWCLLFILPGASAADLVLEAPDVLFLADGTILAAPDGQDGESRVGSGVVLGEDGGPGGSIILRAPIIIAQGLVIAAPGDGGAGGLAWSHGAPHATAIAGNGGPAGRLIIEGEVRGDIRLLPPTGGGGGEARAQAQDSCDASEGQEVRVDQPPAPVGDGADAEARAEDGDCVGWDQSGGKGGDAYARGGDGGIGLDGNGGRGGDAAAYPGRGGDGQDACFSSRGAAEAAGITQAPDGGSGGRMQAYGGAGGTGLVVGGAGGSAYAEAYGGKGGAGTYLLGARDGYRETEGRYLVVPGSGGAAFPDDGTSAVIGGDGGFGTLGGAGGASAGLNFGGDGGDICNISSQGRALPGPGLVATVLVVLAVAWARR